MLGPIGSTMLWTIAAFAAGLFSVIQGIASFRSGKRLWGAFGVVSGLALLLTPVQTRAIKIDFPAANAT